jgi:TolB-like protein/predicted Zn-dependent protease
MDPRNFFAELKRRNVYRVAVAYAIIAWLLIQIATQTFPFFAIPIWAVRLVVSLVLLGFPVALVFAWIFELTPEGLKRTGEVAPHQSIARRTGRKLDFVIIAVLLGVIAFLLLNRTRPTPPPVAAAPEKTIAVLPFENLSDEKENAYFADGVQDDVLTAISKIADLKVISRTSVLSYSPGASRDLSEIAEALRVAHVVEGSVRRSGGNVRVTARLIEARTKVQLWAEHYDRKWADIFAIQSEIAQKIADQLRAKLSPKEQADIEAPLTLNMEAYDLYLRAKTVSRNAVDGRREIIEERTKLLGQAIVLDPTFVGALCQFARAHLAAYWFNHDRTPARLALAKDALDAAARLRPDEAEVHLTRARLHYWGYRDYASALAELELARRTRPNEHEAVYFTSLIERRQGEWEKSLRNNEAAARMDPRNVNVFDNLATTQIALRRYPEAARTLDGILEWRPDDLAMRLTRAWVDIFSRADLQQLQNLLSGEAARAGDPDIVASARLQLALAQRDYRAAREALAVYRPPELRPELSDLAYVTPREWYEGLIAGALGEPQVAEAAFFAARERAAASVTRRPDDGRAMMALAEIDARLGRRQEAKRAGERAVELLSVAKDALDGPIILRRLAGVYAQIGEIDRALEKLELAAATPNSVHYGSLKINEVWDPLRRDPRFERVVASLAPKDN